MPGESSPAVKRSRTVCYRCHEKKIRCDLSLTIPRSEPCSACVDGGTHCRLRPSQKGRWGKERRRLLSDTAAQSRRTVDDESGSSSLEPLPDSGLSEDTGRSEPSRRVTVAPAGESAFLRLISESGPGGNDTLLHAERREDRSLLQTGVDAKIDNISPTLQQSNLETYFELLHVWCPVLSSTAVGPQAPEARDELPPILRNTLALLASSLRPPLLPHALPWQHYERARHLFLNDRDSRSTSFDKIRAGLLLTWWNPNLAHDANMDNSFWWVGAAIRLAQALGLHREPSASVAPLHASLRRRVWWSLYSRERIIAMCQRRPCMIDEDYCDVRPPTLSDFPSEQAHQGHIFIAFISLAKVLNHVNKHLFNIRSAQTVLTTMSITSDLISWLQSLPPSLTLPISTNATTRFDRDTHLLYLPYLATVSLIYLKGTADNPRSLPRASVAAVIAASCTARIFEDFLARAGSCMPFLSMTGAAGSYIAIAILALVHVLPLASLETHAWAHIDLLRTALKHLAQSGSASAKHIYIEIEKVLRHTRTRSQSNSRSDGDVWRHARAASMADVNLDPSPAPSTIDDLCAGDGVQWPDLFLFATAQTSPLIAAILAECNSGFPQLFLREDVDPDAWMSGLWDDLGELWNAGADFPDGVTGL